MKDRLHPRGSHLSKDPEPLNKMIKEAVDIQELIKALEFYANPENWFKKVDKLQGFTSYDPSNVEEDAGHIARMAMDRYRRRKNEQST